jgi:hypothetical protein
MEVNFSTDSLVTYIKPLVGGVYGEVCTDGQQKIKFDQYISYGFSYESFNCKWVKSIRPRS